MQTILQHRLYSIFFMKRRSTNQRGTPVRAAFQWVMLEEARLAVEARMNEDNLSTARPFREILNQFIGM